jgi:hypothetical protein
MTYDGVIVSGCEVCNLFVEDITIAHFVFIYRLLSKSNLVTEVPVQLHA